MRRGTTLLGAAALVALLAGCSADETTDPASAGTTQHPRKPHLAATPSHTEADDGPPFPDSTAAQTADNHGDWDLVLTGVRVGTHDGYDRLVLEFSGTGTPGWSVDYVDHPVLDGSGEAVSIGGDTFLDVYASGTTYPPDDTSGFPTGPIEVSNGGRIGDVYVGGTFEGYTQAVVGIDGDASPVRVFALTDPSRLVVDVNNG